MLQSEKGKEIKCPNHREQPVALHRLVSLEVNFDITLTIKVHRKTPLSHYAALWLHGGWTVTV